MVGLHLPILHGWCSVCRLLKTCEKECKRSYKTIDVDFKSPIFLPRTQNLQFHKNEKNEIIFRITDAKAEKVVLEGKFK